MESYDEMRVSVAGANQLPPCGWVQVPPTTMPWGVSPATHPSVVRFTGGNHTQVGLPYHLGTFQHQPTKRKHVMDMDMPPPKQLITEEKMAAHMSKLHISDHHQQQGHGLVPDEPVMDVFEEEPRMPKLVICEEVRRLKQDPIIPQSILNKMERPKMAMVLWKPPAGQLHTQLKAAVQHTEEKVKEREREVETAVGATQMDSEDMEVAPVFRPVNPFYDRPPFPYS